MASAETRDCRGKKRDARRSAGRDRQASAQSAAQVVDDVVESRRFIDQASGRGGDRFDVLALSIAVCQTSVMIETKRRISPRELFLGFAELGLVSFGGAAVWGRRLLVTKRGWLTADEFNEVLGMGQVLPGPNMVNASVVIGAREAGPAGSLVALAGILLPPLAIVLALVVLFERFGDIAIVRSALRGSALAASGLVLANGLSMGSRLRGNVLGIAIAIVACLLLGVARLSLPLILVFVVPIGIVFVLVRDRRAA